MGETVYLLLGSDTGDREAYLVKAVRDIAHYPDTTLRQYSSLYETEPVGMKQPGGSNFFNLCCAVETTLDPFRMLGRIQETERSLGRYRAPVSGDKRRYRSRTIDIDILLYGGRIIFTNELVIPHPLLHERRFVLTPLAEIAAAVIHPLFRLTVRELNDRNGDGHFVKLLKTIAV